MFPMFHPFTLPLAYTRENTHTGIARGGAGVKG